MMLSQNKSNTKLWSQNWRSNKNNFKGLWKEEETDQNQYQIICQQTAILDFEYECNSALLKKTAYQRFQHCLNIKITAHYFISTYCK